MAICRFYQQGNCKFGNSCRFEHPATNNRNPTQNRFGALPSGGGGNLQDAFSKYSISIDTIEKDLTIETPQWILSSYAPGRNAPEQLFGGFPREQSFEEMRLHYLTAKASGNEQRALSEAQELYQNAQQQIQTSVRNLQDAAKFIVEAENKHPNRVDICQQGTQGAPFGEFAVGKRAATTQQAPSAFGQPAALGQSANPFGQPAFGQPSQPSQTASPFGQPSQPAAGFGRQPAQQTPSAFGQPQPTPQQAPQQAPSAFGQPSALGAKPNPFGTPAFGQPAQPNAGQGSAFGQPSQLGQKPNPFASGGTAANTSASPFGANANAAPNPFGGGNANATASPFANANASPSPFGGNVNNASPSPFAANNNTNAASPFGGPGNANSANAPSSNPFGSNANQNAAPASSPFAANSSAQNNTQPNPFGQPAHNANPSPFGQESKPSPFAASAAPQSQTASNPFAQNSQPQANGSAFSGSSTQNPFSSGRQAQASAAGTAPAGGNPYPPDSTKQHPAADSYISKNMDGSVAAFKGKPMAYKDGKPGIRGFDGTWTRVWFPNGPPSYYKDTELPSDMYDEKDKALWATFAQTGTFADGVMPALPPPRECTQWDF